MDNERHAGDLPWQTETEYYDLHAERMFAEFAFFDQGHIGNTAEEFLRYLTDRLNLTSKSRLLDLGCGSGYLVGQLHGRFCHAMGISTSAVSIRGCRERYPHAQFVEANMESFVVPGMTHVTALESMGYADLRKTIECAAQCLVPRGTLYIREVLRLNEESKEMRANREYLEHYWKWTARKADEVISECYRVGFELMEYHNQTRIANSAFLAECMARHSAAPYRPPYPGKGAATIGEFTFVLRRRSPSA